MILLFNNWVTHTAYVCSQDKMHHKNDDVKVKGYVHHSDRAAVDDENFAAKQTSLPYVP